MAISAADLALSCPIDEIIRTQFDWPEDIWGDQFINYEYDTQMAEKYAKEIQVLKDEVKGMLANDNNYSMVDEMNLIDMLERLGISYHFEAEIEQKLGQFFSSVQANTEDASCYDLYTVAVHFRLFRQHGYEASCESMFRRFVDENGNFQDDLKSNPKGLLSLYEAAHLRVRGEDMLDDAITFTSTNLKASLIRDGLTPLLKKQVERALCLPLHYAMQRIEARRFISIYEDQDHAFINETLVKFAKLDYNLLQMLHKEELRQLTRWWRESNVVTKLPHVRDRLVECFLWAASLYYEPQYSKGRIKVAKVVVLTSLIDDTYDSYGTIQELDILTQAFNRWDIAEIDGLPVYLRPLYEIALTLYTEFGEEVATQERRYAVNYSKEAVKEIVRSYYTEAKWFKQGYIPSFDDYVVNGTITAANIVLVTASLIGMPSATPDYFEWLLNKPKALTAGCIRSRLLNDISSYHRETKKQQVTGIDCYMKEHSVTHEETVVKLVEILKNAWKDSNEGVLKSSSNPRDVLMRLINFDRMVEHSYVGYLDSYSYPEYGRDHVEALFGDPITIDN